jgi:hypothetical protein
VDSPLIDYIDDPVFVVRRKSVQLAVRMSFQYSDNRMNQRKVYERVEELKVDSEGF